MKKRVKYMPAIPWYDWSSAFINIYSRDLPLFLSTDFILSTLHNSYDAILQTIEWQFLEHDISLFVDKWQQGLYLLRIGIENQYVVKEMVIW